jgi:arylsulfatase
MQGEDFSKLYLQEHTTKWRDEFFYEFPSTFPSSYLPIAEALVRKDYKYLFWSQFDYHQLFHVSEDPTEQVDLVNEPSLAGMLLAMKVRFNELKAKVTKEVEVMVVATVQPKEGVHVTQQLAVKPEQEVKQD